MILAGDVGGTKTVLAVYGDSADAMTKIVEETTPSKGESLEALVADFLARNMITGVTRACFGVPGAVVDGTCKVTNLPWIVDEAVLSQTLGIARVQLLNDLQAAAYGMLFLDDSELVSLTPELPLDHKRNFAVIAAGTGLGEALLVWDGEKHIPMASEGGHSSFAPRNDLEFALLKFLQGRHGPHVSWERIIAGPGLGAVYAFLKMHHAEHSGPLESARVRNRLALEDGGSVVGEEAVAGTDDLCSAAVELFLALYGAEAGNLALKGLATGGVFVGGGVAPKLLPLLKGSTFLENFRSKGRFRALLETVPVVVAANAKAPLIGAARFATRLR